MCFLMSFLMMKSIRKSLKMQTKIVVCLKKVCYKVSLCENCQRQSCKAVIGLSIRAKMIGWDVPFYVKIWRILTHPLKYADFLSFFARSASAVTPSKKVQLTRIGSQLRAFQ